MADIVSAEEQAEIDLAIQLSLERADVGGRNSSRVDAIVISDDDILDTPVEQADADDSATESESDAAVVPRSNKRKVGSTDPIAQHVPASKKAKIDDVAAVNGITLPSASSTSAIPSRIELERERLARQAARQALSGNSGDTASRRSAEVKPVANTLSRISTLSALAEKNGDGAVTTSDTSTTNSRGITGGFANMAALGEDASKKRRFWDGLLLPTSSRHHSGYDCLTFRDVIGDTDQLRSALLTTFCGEPDWIHAHFPPNVNVGLVMPCAQHGRPEVVDYSSNMKIFNPRRETAGRGCMHIKLIMLYYKDFLRIGVSSANLIDYDWATIENACYVQDFRQLTSDPASDQDYPFLETLIRVHESLETPVGWYSRLRMFDFCKTTRVRLVLSVPGTYKGQKQLQANGHIALAKALQDLSLQTPTKGAHLTLECQGSSIGAYTLEWMRTFYRSAMGWDPMTPSGAGGFSSDMSRKRIPWRENQWPNIKVVYPTFKNVKDSLNGPGGGGTLFCSVSQFQKPGYPRQLFHDSHSQRAGLLQHTKMILGIIRPGDIGTGESIFRKNDEQEEDAIINIEPFGFLYIGSHNFTPAAWGRYSEKTGSLTISNHELGIIIGLHGDNVDAQASKLVTWKRPLEPYAKTDLPTNTNIEVTPKDDDAAAAASATGNFASGVKKSLSSQNLV